jgi:hypothetical protein
MPTREEQMKEDIGNAAGVIWEFLDQQSEPVTLGTLRKGVNLSANLMMMGLGWLARENKLGIDTSGNAYSIYLQR